MIDVSIAWMEGVRHYPQVCVHIVTRQDEMIYRIPVTGMHKTFFKKNFYNSGGGESNSP